MTSFNSNDYDYLITTLTEGSLDMKTETLRHLLILLNKD